MKPKPGGEQARKFAEHLLGHMGVLRILFEDDLRALMAIWRGGRAARKLPICETRLALRELFDAQEALLRELVEKGFEHEVISVHIGDCEIRTDLADVLISVSPQVAQARHVETLLASIWPGASKPPGGNQGRIGSEGDGEGES